MKIGMMADVYKPHTSGITNYIALNKRVLEEMGHEVYVFTFGDNYFVDDEPNIIRSPGLPLLDTGYFIGFRYNKIATKLLKKMDVVHVHHPFLSGSLALRYCRSRGIPIVFTNHTRYDLYARAYIPALPDAIGESALEAFLPAFCRSCDLIIAPSNGMRKVLERIGVTSTIEVVPNGVDITPLRQTIQPFSRRELGIPDNAIVLIYTGRLGPEKNLIFLLRSVSGVLQAFDHVFLLLVGDGPERENLEDRVKYMGINSRVHFVGMVPHEEIYTYLVGADAFVTASVTEVHPLSVIEAMAAGLPVLGIDSPGIGDTIEDGISGYLVHDEDLAAFTAKLVRLISEDQRRKMMGSQARQEAEKYAIEKTAAMMVEKYEQAIYFKQTQPPGFRVLVTRFLDKLQR